MCLPSSLTNLSNMPIVFNILELVLNHGCVIVNWYEYVLKPQFFNVNWYEPLRQKCVSLVLLKTYLTCNHV